MSWKLIQNAERRLGRETALVRPASGGDVRVALGYPNTYYVGMSNLGFQVVYGFLNRIQGVSCERFFLPDPDELEEYDRHGRRLFTLESQRPVGEYDLVGFTLAYEPDYTNFLRMLELSGLKLLSKDRDDDHPLILVGGALTLLNPEPIADFVDVFCVGEAEGRMPELVAALRRKLDRRKTVEAIAAIPGFYVPSLHRPRYENQRFAGFEEPAPMVSKTYISAEEFAGQETHSLVLTDDTEFSRSLLLEVSRGCPYVCRFCTVGFSYPKVRWKPIDRIWEAVETAREGGLDFERVGLVSATVGNHPDIAKLCERLRTHRIPVSLLLRADQLPDELLAAMVEGGTRSLTLAPETGSEDLRKSINKRFTDVQYYDAARRAFQAGIKKIKMYSMVGLPHERDEDVDALVEMVKTTRGLQKEAIVTLGLGLFVPKPLTPFQWAGMCDSKLAEERMKRVQKSLARVGGVKVNFDSPKVSLIEALLARGDRRLAGPLLEVYKKPTYRAWLQALENHNLSLEELVYRERDPAEPQPWDHLGASWAPERLVRDLARSVRV